MLAFSTVDRDSFEAIESWKRKVKAGVIVHRTRDCVCTFCDYVNSYTVNW